LFLKSATLILPILALPRGSGTGSGRSSRKYDALCRPAGGARWSNV